MKENMCNYLKKDAIHFFKKGLESIDSYNLVQNRIRLNKNILSCNDIMNKLQTFNLDNYEKVFVVGAGKACSGMARAIEEILDDKLTDGIIVTKYGFTSDMNKIQLLEAGHPLPDKNGRIGAGRISEICKSAGKNDLVINLISGGASALLPFPSPDISLDEKAYTTKLLLESGATIDELNCLRKHLSQIKGGQLAKLAYPATVVSFILSDVINDELDTIGSGITVPDRTTFKDCKNIIDKYELGNRLPESVSSHINNGVSGEIDETPKMDDPVFDNVSNLIIGNNSIMLNSIKSIAEREGFRTTIRQNDLNGEANNVGVQISKDAKEFKQNNVKENESYCFLYGGETSVTVNGSGMGGRNQELALAAAIELQGIEDIVILSGGTDGNDGPTDAAGAVADGSTLDRSKEIGLSAKKYLENNDSYNFFKQLDDLLITGPTNTNVMDIQVVLIRSEN